MASTFDPGAFDGRWILVTGASSGLGRAIAIELASQGCSVILGGRDPARLAATASALKGRPHVVWPLDLSEHAAIAAGVQRLGSEVGPIYGLCHSAGTVLTRPLASSSVEVVQAQLGVNLVAGLELARAVCRRDVLHPEGGSLLFLSSVYGRAGMAGQVAYSASKGALVAAVRSLAVELARRRVRANCLSPGFVDTEMTRASLSAERAATLKAAHPLGPGQPEDVARAAAFLLSPASRWITGVDLPVDGGYTAQ
ncbi:MAG: SDR family oxidoreductase [Rubrivivax sp.]|nr:SDR family oxidoreductase [Rubrivivax sp.]